jgi:hypothetical protein
MAGIDVDEAIVGIDGLIATGEVGVATAPTNATGDLAGNWTDQGLVTDVGVTRSEEVTATTLRAWQRNRIVKRTVTESAVRWVFILVQTSADTVELFHGVPVDPDTGKVTIDLTAERPHIAFCIDVINDDDQVVREYAPNAQVVEVGDQVAVAGDFFGWPVTIEADYDDTISGHTERWFSGLSADGS